MKPSSTGRKALSTLLAAAIWLAVWQIASMAVKQEILLVSPVSAFQKLIELMGTGAFYRSVFNSFGRIALGFLLALVLGVALAALAKAVDFVRTLLSPLMTAIKATPVASFVILALVWISSRRLSIFTSLLIALPVVYVNVLAGLDGADPKLLEMAAVFRVGLARRVRAIYVPAAFRYLLAACRMALGMCWKAGVAAEVIGQPQNSVGDALYRAKLFLATDELFAWTLAIILISVVFEKLAIAGIGRIERLAEGR